MSKDTEGVLSNPGRLRPPEGGAESSQAETKFFPDTVVWGKVSMLAEVTTATLVFGGDFCEGAPVLTIDGREPRPPTCRGSRL